MTPAELELLLHQSTQDRSTHLDLYQNQISKLPDSIGNLTDLVSLRLTDNRLTTLPDSIGNLTKLRELRVYRNQLRNLPDSIANLQNLTWLSLSLNRLTVFPGSIAELTNLTGLLLNGNQMVALPHSITKLTNLTYLDITGNPLMDLSVLHDLPKLKTVKFWGVKLPCKYWIELKSLSSALQLVDGAIVEYQIKPENLRYLGKQSLIWLPSNLDRYLPTKDKKDERIDTPPESLSFIGRVAKQMFGDVRKNIESKALEYHLHLSGNQLTSLPSDIGKMTKLTCIEASTNKLASLPASIGNLNNLTHLDLRGNQLSCLPSSIDNLTNLTHLYLSGNLLQLLPDGISEMVKLIKLDLTRNSLTMLPSNIDRLVNLISLNLSGNQLIALPASIKLLTNLTNIHLSGNPQTDLSILPQLPRLTTVNFFGVNLPRRYWTKFSEWKARWLLDEQNAELRRRLIQQIGYERICQELQTIPVDTWREYTLLKIDNMQIVYRGWQEVGREPLVLLKMTCPSTGHIHVLRVPPDMISAEAAITWVNHGIHPDKFIIQT
jgi:leucine-rich repeat protein SHOC2